MRSLFRSGVAAWSLALVFAAESQAADPAPAVPELVSHDQLEADLGKPDLRLLDVRPHAAYEKGHLPGAVSVDVKSAEELARRPGGLADKAAWAAWIRTLGIDKNTRVLVYDGSRQLSAARYWWLLTYLGVDRVGLIDGDFGLWESQGRKVSTEEAKVTPRPFEIAFREDVIASRQDILDLLKNGKCQIVDARSIGEYTGKVAMAKRGGHMPGACRLEWSTLVDEKGRFLDEASLREKVAALGLASDQPVVTHCQGGIRSSVDAFVLRRLGIPARNYFQGWAEWGNLDDSPVETTTP